MGVIHDCYESAKACSYIQSTLLRKAELLCNMIALVVAVLIASGKLVEVSAQEEVITISRSGDGDLFEVSSSEGSCFNESCAGDFSTYLVEERECENDSTLQRNCSVQLVPIIPNTFTTSSISSFIAGDGTLLVLDSVTYEYGMGRVHSNDGIRQAPEECRVRSLEVIRGRTQATQIDHSGFSIITGSIGITIRVVTDNLTYNRTDYDGEVFRMNIVCDANTNVDCVFFKLNGTTDLRKEKFGGLVSLFNSSVDYCLSSTTQPTSITPLPPSTTITTDDRTTFTSSNITTNVITVTKPISDIVKYVLIGLAALVTLILVAVLACACIGVYLHRSRKSKQSLYLDPAVEADPAQVMKLKKIKDENSATKDD